MHDAAADATRLLSLAMLPKLTKAEPEDGCMSPVRMPIVVVLPAPLGPSKPKTCRMHHCNMRLDEARRPKATRLCGAHLSYRNANTQASQRVFRGCGSDCGIHPVQITQLYHVLRLPVVRFDPLGFGCNQDYLKSH